MKTYRRELWIALSLAAVTLLLYAPLRHYDFVNFDDPQNVFGNPWVKAGMAPQSVRWALTTTEDYWRPLTRLSHLLDVELFGMDAGAHHRTNVILHVLNTLLLFGVLRGMTGSVWRSAWVTAVFAIHPLQVESVAWVTERKDVLSSLFWMLTLAAYACYVQGRGGRAVGWYAATILFFALGLTAKPMLITLPCVLLLLDVWPLRRFATGVRDQESGVRKQGAESRGQRAWGRGQRSEIRGQRSEVRNRESAIGIWKLFAEKIPFFALAAASVAFTLMAQHSEKAIMQLVPLSGRIAYALTSYVTYIRRIFIPLGLGVMHPGMEKAPALHHTLSAAALLLVITGFALWTARRRPALLIGWLWFVGTLVPVIGILQLGAQSTADRFTYLPIIGLLMMLVWGLAELPGTRWKKKILPACAALSLAACAFLSWRQIPSWKDSFTLFEYSLKHAGPTTVAYHNLGATYITQKRWAEAEPNYRAAVRMDPMYDSAHCGLGVALANLGRLDEAAVHLREAARITPGYVEAINNLGQVYEMAGREADAVEQYRELLRLVPDQSLPPRKRLDRILARQNARLRAARAALEQKPDDAAALNNLAWLLATAAEPPLRNGGEAAALAERACALTGGGTPALLDTLAAAYAEAGRFEDAVTTAERAAELAGTSGDEAQAAKIRIRLDLYRVGLPFRQ